MDGSQPHTEQSDIEAEGMHQVRRQERQDAQVRADAGAKQGRCAYCDSSGGLFFNGRRYVCGDCIVTGGM